MQRLWSRYRHWLAGTGIGDSSIRAPKLLRGGKLIEVIPKLDFSAFHPWLVQIETIT